MHEELAALFAADRLDHDVPTIAGTPEYTALRQRDAARRQRAATILATESVVESLDWYHAAWLFNHGDTPADAETAYRLAERAALAGERPGRWLYAAAYDRWCMYSGQPQRYGTQIVPDGRRYRLWDTDPTTTDADRANFDVPTIAELHRRAIEMTTNHPQPPLNEAPDWLKAAIHRWTHENQEH